MDGLIVLGRLTRVAMESVKLTKLGSDRDPFHVTRLAA